MAKPATKICKYCKTEIPYGAKICPNCRKKQKGKAKWIVIAVVALLFIGAIVSSNDTESTTGTSNSNKEATTTDKQETKKSESTQKPKETHKENPTPEPAKKELFEIGEPAEYKNIIVTLKGFSENQGSQFNTPSDGNVFVLLEFEIENNSKNELNISSMISFDAYADDYAVNFSLGALIEKGNKNQLDGTIASGKKMNGVIGYEVPEDWEKIEVNFTSNVWSNSKYKFVINK